MAVAIQPVGPTPAIPASERVNERVQPPVAPPIPPLKQTEKQPGANTSATGERKRGDSHSNYGGQTSTFAMGSASDIKSQFQAAEKELKEMFEKVNRRLSFRLHEDSERVMVQVIDNRTNEVVREVPPEKFLNTIAKVREFVGILFDDWF